jgi:ATP-dependent helicase/nuclease subunit A
VGEWAERPSWRSGDGLDALAEGQALAEDIPDLADQLAAAARAALSSPIIVWTASRPHWREAYVGTVVDDTLVEGYVDLLIRNDDELVIVDYKTDATAGPEVLAAYETQPGVYSRAIADAAARSLASRAATRPR